MAVLAHTVNFHVVFSGLNDFVQSGDYVISDNTVSEASDFLRTIDQVNRSPDVDTYTPIDPFETGTTNLKFEWWYYREAEMWTFNLWDTSSKVLFANEISQTLYNSMHGSNMQDWIDIYGQANFDGDLYPAIYDMNVYVCWGKALLTDKINTLSNRLIYPFFYVGNDPNYDYLVTINEKTV